MVDDEKAVTILTGNEVECAEAFGYDDDLARAGARASPKKCGPSLLVAEHAGLQPGVAERAARVEPLHQADEVGMALVEQSNCRCVRMEDLAPVRARLERGQGILDLSDHLLDRVWLALPGEVDGDGVFLVVHAHPQPIRSHPANLAHLQDGSHPVCEGAHGFYGPHGMPAREQGLRLDFFAAAGRVAHAEMR